MVNPAKPIIGVTGPEQGGDLAWICTRFMIWLAGGKALRLTPSRRANIDKIDGVVLGGGSDIDPVRYKETLAETVKRESKRVRRFNFRFLFSVLLWLARRVFSIKSSRGVIDKDRDDAEFTLLKQCVEREIPVLGICRGSQLMNVFWGGSLYQNIANFYVETPQLRTLRARKAIFVEPGTTLGRIMNREKALVNSLHDQSVKDLGFELRIAAQETNGVIQAIEHRSLPFMIGVQWHPEFLPLHPEQRRFFRYLVQAAKVHRKLHA